MSRAHRVWRASFTRRWHTNPDLCDTCDYVAGHQGRVALLVSVLKPDASRALLMMALVHDQGEAATGDLPAPVKRELPAISEALQRKEKEEIREQFPGLEAISEREYALLKLCDWLDAWLWMMRHARHLYAREDWQGQIERMRHAAYECGVFAEFMELIDAEVTRG